MFPSSPFLAFALGWLMLASVWSQPALRCPDDPAACQLPNCRCSSQDIPKSLSPAEVPQMVLFTFDDAVHDNNYWIYDEILSNRRNPNGARASATFFVSHEYTDYTRVHQLWEAGHEIALHSITHHYQVGNEYWSTMNETQMWMEAIDQIEMLCHFASIPRTEVKGYRAPFLQMSGNAAYEALCRGGLEYECSRPSLDLRKPGLWPYTNDYLSTQDCAIPPCADKEFPGFWTFPMIGMVSSEGHLCVMLDTCPPAPTTEDEMLKFLWDNFYDHYNGTRSPFPMYLHSPYLTNNTAEGTARRSAILKFFNQLSALPDVYLVSVFQALEWTKNPTSLPEIQEFAPWQDKIREQMCETPKTCELKFRDSVRYMGCCTTCPETYPWLGNPLGLGPTPSNIASFTRSSCCLSLLSGILIVRLSTSMPPLIFLAFSFG